MLATVDQILQWTGGRLANGESLGRLLDEIRVEKPVPLTGAKNGELAFFFSKLYQDELINAAPGVLITGEPFVEPLRKSGLPLWITTAVIACPDPYYAMAVLSEKLGAPLSTISHVPPVSGAAFASEKQIHASAVVDPTAQIGQGVRIGPHCVIEGGVRIGARSILYPGCYVGPDCSIGEDCVLFPGVTLYEWTRLGDRVRVHAQSVLGADGFGYAPRRVEGAVTGQQKIYHVGKVIIGDDVEIGANSCVDRGTFGETRIEKNAKIDNLVQVGHNAHVEEGAILCGGSCFAGNSSVGRFALVGGLCGVTNHVHIGAGSSVAAMTLVSKDVPDGGTAVGNPQRDHSEHFRVHALLSRLLKDRAKKREL
ncbi:MAG: hypothetical protein A2X94_01270 [Bdellovibrionales bacterium GWB1_55_8]|nr:MAG: hypothetical protein A2X94_01270 [Bdellovibrionales bacterium GWB1_55_8]